MSFTAHVFRDRIAGCYYAHERELPGCWTQGDTLEDLQSNLTGAVHGWLESVARLPSPDHTPR